MAKSPLEKALEKYQKEIERQVKKQIEAKKGFRKTSKNGCEKRTRFIHCCRSTDSRRYKNFG